MRSVTISKASVLMLVLVPASMSFSQGGDYPNAPATFRLLQPAATYWTEVRRRNAKPIEAPTASSQERERMVKERDKGRENESLPPVDLRAFGIPTRADVTASPYRHAGHLYFTRDGEDRICTAQFVGDVTVLLTAAHCLQNATTGAWATNIMFLRAFENGSQQQLVGIVCPAVFRGWVTETGLDRMKWDYAFLKTSTASSSGAFGLTINLPYTAWEAIGYPVNFGALQQMQRVSGTKGTVYRGRVEMLGNPMRSGSSGGAWHVDGYAIGNNSFDVPGDNNAMWSPYYDDNTLTLWRYALNNCQ